MTVRELQDLLEDFDPDTEVKFAMQPSWPMQYKVADAIEVEVTKDNWAVYLVEEEQEGYLPENVVNVLNWGK